MITLKNITLRRGARVLLDDASGTINVEIDDEHWPAQAISETATVKITGEVDRDLMSREIDVEYLELVN